MLVVNNVSKVYRAGGQRITALQGVSMEFKQGEFVAIVGDSGCGKTTLLNIIAGLLHPTEGFICYDGNIITEKSQNGINEYRKNHVGIILQKFSLLNDRNIYNNVELPLKIHKYPKDLREKLVTEYLEKVNMSEKRYVYPNNLSGGQQQRVAIARALVSNPDIILADEPTGALDEQNAEQIVNILRQVSNEGKIVIMVTHHLKFLSYCDRYIKLDEGKVV